MARRSCARHSGASTADRITVLAVARLRSAGFDLKRHLLVRASHTLAAQAGFPLRHAEVAADFASLTRLRASAANLLLLRGRRGAGDIHHYLPLAVLAFLPHRGVAAGELVVALAALKRPARVAQVAALRNLGRLHSPVELKAGLRQELLPLGFDRGLALRPLAVQPAGLRIVTEEAHELLHVL